LRDSQTSYQDANGNIYVTENFCSDPYLFVLTIIHEVGHIKMIKSSTKFFELTPPQYEDGEIGNYLEIQLFGDIIKKKGEHLNLFKECFESVFDLICTKKDFNMELVFSCYNNYLNKLKYLKIEEPKYISDFAKQGLKKKNLGNHIPITESFDFKADNNITEYFLSAYGLIAPNDFEFIPFLCANQFSIARQKVLKYVSANKDKKDSNGKLFIEKEVLERLLYNYK
jgi:hypothetical protein